VSVHNLLLNSTSKKLFLSKDNYLLQVATMPLTRPKQNHISATRADFLIAEVEQAHRNKSS
jgi:hypothetical protein